ncbi:hypothetical protein C8R44DRAFT_770037 [Mycena epipterygia]|nr:hypothetical protein C8R44DRAFT_770037 [Mycena epipterygia]
MWFPERRELNKLYDDIDKSLKKMSVCDYILDDSGVDFSSGTFPFIAIEIIENNTSHGPHHDESAYWLLMWMILRYTDHTHPSGALAKRDFLFNRPLLMSPSHFSKSWTPFDWWFLSKTPPLLVRARQHGPKPNLTLPLSSILRTMPC